MAREITPYLFVDRLFFEDLGNYEISGAYSDLLEKLLPDSWKVLRDKIWLHALPNLTKEEPRTDPGQGFKIHISATPRTATTLLEAVVPECAAEGAPFKISSDPQLLLFMSSKSYGRGSSSKFIVIYPRDLSSFKSLLTRLYEKTAHLEGAYILSDRQFKDSKVLFYRFGGFKPKWKMNIDGHRTPLIEAPEGKLIPDERLPYFKLPSWVDDPFGGSNDIQGEEDVDDGILNERYKVQSSLAFSNSGGVYKALDLKTGQTVVLKEARPLTNLWSRGDGSYFDAVSVLEHEFRILNRLTHLPFVVKPLELFREWEHSFLVQEWIHGIPLARYRSRDEFHLFPIERNLDKLWNFCTRYRTIAMGLVKHLAAIHEAGVVLGDISPSNILIDPETLGLHFIDLETAVEREAGPELKRFSSSWSTPGFRKHRPERRQPPGVEDDLYALGMTLLSLILPVTTLFDLESASEQRILEKIRDCVDLPKEVELSISALRDGDSAKAQQILEEWDVDKTIVQGMEARRPEKVWAVSTEDLLEATRKIADLITNTTTPERQDRLWPGDVKLFQTNPMSVAHGACGIALFLKRVMGELHSEVKEWMFARKLSLDKCPPGLYSGLAGIAYTFTQLGYSDRAAQAMDISYQSPLLFTESNWFEGAAGWGWVNLHCHTVWGDTKYFERAVEAGEKVLANAEENEKGCFWRRNRDGKLCYGICYGAAGVALFLLHLYKSTQDERYLCVARKAMCFELANAIERPNGLGWVRWEGDNMAMPYWLYGSSGIGSVLIRFFQEFGVEEDLRAAKLIAADAFSRLTVQPTQFEGLSSIGEFMLDMYLATRDESYLSRAHDVADSILRYRIERPEGMAFPGRYLLRISNDFGTGGAGVGLFLDRLTVPGPRLLHDLNATCDRSKLQELACTAI